ncbi:MAG: N-acetylmuramoyl-L-alanine amidase [Gammaproteobacteria bacterium]
MPTLVVQMGHTGRPPNPGSVGTAGEQDFARAAGAACTRLLDGRGGWAVRLVLADPPLSSYRGDAFVAIHCDGSLSSASRGASLGHQTSEGRELAHAIRAAYERCGWSGGWKPDNYTSALSGYYGVRNAVGQGNRRSMIFETGTMTNTADRALLLGPGGHDRVALAVGNALGIPMEDDMLTDERAALLALRDHLLPGVAGVRPAGAGAVWAYDVWQAHTAPGETVHVELTDEQLDRLVRGIVAALPASVTPDQLEAALRRVFADAGTTP